MRAAIMAILDATASPFTARQQIEGLGPYRSRGHGGGHNPTGMLCNATVRSRSASRYEPHQGARERARRLRSKLESKPRRVWQIAHPNPSITDETLISASARRPALQLVRRLRQSDFYCPPPVLEVLHG